MRQLFIAILLLLYILPTTGKEKQKTNFLIIVIDDLGYADLRAFKHHAPDVHTPNMDRLAARSILFTEAYATAPVCSPSRAGFNTGMYQVRWDPASSFNCGLPDKVKNLAEMMKENGYVTAMFGKNDYGNPGYNKHNVREYPLNHGYDEFLGFSAHGHDYFLLSEDIEKHTPDPRGPSANVGPLMHNEGYKSFDKGYTTEIFTDAAIDYLKLHREEPFFVKLSYNSVHHLIHQTPKKYLDKYGVKEIPNYDPATMGKYRDWFQRYIKLGEITDDEMRRYYLANLNCLDDNIGRVLDALDDLSLIDNTVVILFSDNGGAPTNGATNLPLSGSKFTLWEGGIRVPFIISRPNEPQAGEVFDMPVSLLDVVPTCLFEAGIDIPENLDGEIIPKTDKTNTSKRERMLFWQWGKSYAARIGDWKLLYKGGGRAMGRKPYSRIKEQTELINSICLFNLKDNPSESENLYDKHPEIVQKIQKEYDNWKKNVVGSNIKEVNK